MSRSDPPRFPRMLLEWALPEDVRESVVGDLDELFQRRHHEYGAARANVWYVRESLAFATRFAVQRLREQELFRLDGARRDLTAGFRRLRRKPAFAVVVVVTLALGIGANAAIFQMVEALRLRSLPVADPQSLVILELADMTRWEGRRTSGYPVLTNPLWERIREGGGPFEATLAWANATFVLQSSESPVLVRGMYVSGGFFDALGVVPVLGRTFHAEDDRPGCGTEGVVLSHGFWQRVFGGDRSIVGRSIVLDSRPVPVLGVTAPAFTGLEVGRAYDVAVPICAQQVLGGAEEWLEDGTVWWLTVMGRLPEGRSIEAVNSQLGVWSASLFEATLPADPADRIESYLDLRLRAVPGHAGVSSLRERYGDPLIALLAVTGLVLLMVCTNLANLFLARGKGREREFAVRRALGASGGHLLRDLSMESMVLAAAGAAGGLALAGVLGGALLRFLGPDLSLDLSLNAPTMSFVVLAAGLSCLLFGLIPAWQASAGSGDRGLEAVREGRGTSPGSRGARLRRALVVSQVALSFVLLFGALLFTSTLRNLLAIDTGFDASNVMVARVDFGTFELDSASRPAFKRDLLERVRGVPGVASVAEVRHVPMGGTGSSATVGRDEDALAAGVSVRLNGVTTDYLDAMGMRLLAGRGFDPRDAPDAPVAVVTPAFASRLGLAANPVGGTFRIEGSPRAMEIIGLVPDAKYFDLREEPVPTAFVPKDLLTDARSYTDFVIRTATSPSSLPDRLRQAIAPVSSGISIDVRPLEDIIGEGLLRERLMSTVAGFFGILAALVATIGLYGVVSHLVAQRRNEIAVRIALGARRRSIILMVLLQAGALLAAGLLLGVVLASVASTAARQFLFGLGPRPVPVYLLAAGLLTLAACIACYLPARRAARLEPQEALRLE